MRPLRVRLRSFCQYGDAQIDLEGASEVAIVGQNGAGKSTIFDAITWALYGECERGSADDLVRIGDVDMSVTLEFEMGGMRYRIERARELGKQSSLGFYALTPGQTLGIVDPWARLTRRTIAETNDAIREVLGGLPYETFLVSNMIAQGRADEFARLTPAARKRALYDVLGPVLDRYARMEEGAAELWRTAVAAEGLAAAREQAAARAADTLPAAESALSGARGASERARGEAGAADDAVAGAREWIEALAPRLRDLAALEAERRNAERDEARAAAELKSTNADLAAARRLLEDEGEIRAANEHLREARDERARAGARAMELLADGSEIDRELGALRSDARAIRVHRASVERSIAEAHEAADHLRHQPEVCATCPFVDGERRRAADADGLAFELGRIDAQLRSLDEQIEVREARRDAATRRIAEANDEVGRIDRRIRELAPRADLLPRITAARIQADALGDRAYALAREHADAVARRAELDEEVALLLPLREQDARHRRNLAALEARARLAHEAERAAAVEMDRAERAVESARLAASERDAARAERDEHARAALLWRYLQEACGRDGIPALIIENAVPAIEDVANDVLGRLPGGMSVRLLLRRQLKSADRMADTLDIDVEGARTGRRYESLSGGEKERVNLALRIGIARVASTRYGSQIRFLAVDEALAGQDADGLARSLEVLSAARRYFDLVMVVSHLREVSDRFPTRLVVTKDEQGSHVAAA